MFDLIVDNASASASALAFIENASRLGASYEASYDKSKFNKHHLSVLTVHFSNCFAGLVLLIDRMDLTGTQVARRFLPRDAMQALSCMAVEILSVLLSCCSSDTCTVTQ